MAGYTNSTGSSGGDDEACMLALSLLGGYIVPMTLKAAIELGLIDQLLASDGRAVTAAELAARLPRPTKAVAMVDRMLRFLASHRVVRCATELGPDGNTRQTTYTAAPVCNWLAGNDDGEGSIVPFGQMILDKTILESWYHMKEAVLEGKAPFEKAYGMPLYGYLGANESFNTLFNQAMASHSGIITRKLIEFFGGFKDLDVLVDVGGGSGTTLQMIKGQYKNLRGINYDLPHVIAQTTPIEGVEHVAGSMFDTIPQGNAILLKWILHNWGDVECVKILKNCYKALPVNGKVILIEYILPATPEPTLQAQGAFQCDLAMLSFFAHGKERTEREFSELAMEAGFSGDCKSTYIFCNVWALQFTK